VLRRNSERARQRRLRARRRVKCDQAYLNVRETIPLLELRQGRERGLHPSLIRAESVKKRRTMLKRQHRKPVEDERERSCAHYAIARGLASNLAALIGIRKCARVHAVSGALAADGFRIDLHFDTRSLTVLRSIPSADRAESRSRRINISSGHSS